MGQTLTQLIGIFDLKMKKIDKRHRNVLERNRDSVQSIIDKNLIVRSDNSNQSDKRDLKEEQIKFLVTKMGSIED